MSRTGSSEGSDGSEQAHYASRRRSCWFVVLPVLAIFTGSGLFYWHNVLYPACCDAVLYGGTALGIRENGIFSPLPQGILRTLGYPLFLSLLLPSDFDPNLIVAPPALGVVLAQTVLYAAACLSIFLALKDVRREIAWGSLWMLAFSPVALSATAQQLSEGLIVPLAVSLGAVALKLRFGPAGARRDSLLAFAGGLLAGCAMEVRPALVVLPVAWLFFLGVHLTGRSWRDRLTIAFVGLVGLAAPLSIQIMHNWTVYRQFTPFPTMSLGSIQMEMGTKAVKYATVLSGGDGRRFYLNPFYGVGDPVGREFYWQKPWSGALTSLLHIFASVDVDHLFTYIYNLKPWYRVPVNVFNHAVLFLAAYAAAVFTWTRGFLNGLIRDEFSVFVAAVIIGTCAVNAVAVVEVRFGIMVHIIAGPFAAYGALLWYRSDRRRKSFVTVLLLLYLATALQLSEWIDNLAVHGPLKS